MSLFQTFGAVAAASLLVGVPPADAQHRGGGHSGGSGGGHTASARAAAPRSFGAPRVAAPRAFGGSRIVASAPRSFSYGGPRVYAAAQRRGGGAVIGHAVSRGYGPRVIVGA